MANNNNKITLEDRISRYIRKRYKKDLPDLSESELRTSEIYTLTVKQMIGYLICALCCSGLIICLFQPYVTVHFSDGDIQYSIAELSGSDELWSPGLDFDNLFFMDLIGLICCLLPLFINRRWANYLVYFVYAVIMIDFLVFLSAGFDKAIQGILLAGLEVTWRVATLGRGRFQSVVTFDQTSISSWIDLLHSCLFCTLIVVTVINVKINKKVNNERLRQKQFQSLNL